MNNALRSSPTRAPRRSARIPLRIRLTVRLANDAQFDSETTMISRFGAKLRIGHFDRKLVSGDRVSIRQRGGYTWREARIAWIDRSASCYCGIELDDPQNFWGVHFPEKPAPDCDDFAARRGFTPLAVRPGLRQALPVTPSRVS